MASHAPPPVCSMAAYQNFLPLAGFPPAQGWCSTVSLLPKRNKQDSAHALMSQDVQCPLGSSLCALLAELKTADREFARGVCCCVGVCVGNEPSVIVTIPETAPPAPAFSSTSTASQASRSSMTYIQRHSSDSLLPAPSSSMTYIQRHSSDSLLPAPSSSMAYIQRHSSDSLEPMPSVLTSLTSSSSTSSSIPSSNPAASSSSSSSSSRSSLSSSSSSSSSITSSSTSSSASSTCTSVVGGSITYTEYYSGTGYVENTNHFGQGSYPPSYSTLSGTLAMCAAAQACASIAGQATSLSTPAFSFDLHYVISNATWECVSFHDSGGSAQYFNVADLDVGAAYGYSE